MAREFKIFYSWQSDLTGNQTRYFLLDIIDSTVVYLANTVTVIPDRDTKDTIGSPNIEQTIISKINECDLFIADLSIVGSYTDKDGNTKYTSNPNVLFELGYAVKVLSWDRVICFMNTDYGKISDLPFDLNHHRIMGFSLTQQKRDKVKQDIRDIIASTVMTIMEDGLKPHTGFASHIVGTYDFETKMVTEQLTPFSIQTCDFALNYKNALLNEARRKIDEVFSIKLPPVIEEVVEVKGIEKKEENELIEIDGEKYRKCTPQKIDLFSYQKEKIAEEDQKKLTQYVKSYFDIELNEEFFYLGNLEVQTFSFAGMGLKQRGDENAKQKYWAIQDCIREIKRIRLFETYLMTFEGMLYFPLAIWNKTSISDKDISISVVVDESTAEIVFPDEDLIVDELRHIGGRVYKDGFLEYLFKMPDTADITGGNEDISMTSAELRNQFSGGMLSILGLQEPQYDVDDYVDEIQKYIAMPLDTSSNEFNFYISKLRACEKNWVGKGILLKPKKNEIDISYKIISERSDGGIEGNLIYRFQD